MKDLSDYIQEALKITKDSKIKDVYKYHPKTKSELIPIIESLIDMNGWEADLNEIDTSEITDMEGLFNRGMTIYFNGDISNWNVSNVKNMKFMFHSSKFNGDISKWDVSNVKNMAWMFANSKFNGDISKWDVSKVKDMTGMFYGSEFNRDLSNWDVSNVKYMGDMFKKSPLENNPPKWYTNE